MSPFLLPQRFVGNRTLAPSRSLICAITIHRRRVFCARNGPKRCGRSHDHLATQRPPSLFASVVQSFANCRNLATKSSPYLPIFNCLLWCRDCLFFLRISTETLSKMKFLQKDYIRTSMRLVQWAAWESSRVLIGSIVLRYWIPPRP